MLRQPVVVAALILGISLMASALIIRGSLQNLARALERSSFELGQRVERAGQLAGN